MKVKLNAKLDKPGHGFYDPEGQSIHAKHPAAGKEFQKGQVLEVEDTSFVREKIRNGELILVSESEKKDGK